MRFFLGKEINCWKKLSPDFEKTTLFTRLRAVFTREKDPELYGEFRQKDRASRRHPGVLFAGSFVVIKQDVDQELTLPLYCSVCLFLGLQIMPWPLISHPITSSELFAIVLEANAFSYFVSVTAAT